MTRSTTLPRTHDSVVAMLEHPAAEFGERIALVQGEGRLQLLAQLDEAGEVAFGDRVFDHAHVAGRI